MRKYFLSLLTWCLSTEVFVQINPQLDIGVKTAVIEVDLEKNTVYARKLEGGIVFSFVPEEVYEKKIRGIVS